MCQWDVRDPAPANEVAARVPLPPPRPKPEARAGKKF
jgi:hypothetical protein